MAWKWCYFVVGHTLSYIVSKFGVNWTDGFWDTAIFVSYPPVLLIWPLSDILEQRHGLRTNPTAVHHPICQATADAITSVLTARMASVSLPVYDWDSKDAYHSFSIFQCTLENWLLLNQTVRTTSDMSLQPWEPNPWRCMHNGCLLAVKRNREWPRWKHLPSSTESSREWHMMSTPMCAWENSKMLQPGWEGTPKISSHASRHWWTAARWSMMSTASTSCIAISSLPTTMRESSLGNLWQNHSRHPLVS